ncbi:hypothetical protein KUL150_28780 [Alteromonas sp. KUL150]|uniref:hypothetical protein n=1 Tax=Alteromonas sp. KUL150 TaxID=2480805 RepID=UPI0012E6506A|nr:hypothetical protein [Alteromonas sp. KUL150]GFD86819.1 hypothetical protein KUL150_28780 [Alteromonas sp. KUL150]
MNVFEIELRFCVGERSVSMDDIDDKLYEAGFGDALVGHGGEGKVSITLSRTAASERALISSVQLLIKEIFPKATWL